LAQVHQLLLHPALLLHLLSAPLVYPHLHLVLPRLQHLRLAQLRHRVSQLLAH
jgi:hypothetical protein